MLRNQLGFDGLVITDAMDMGGLAAHFDPGEAAVNYYVLKLMGFPEVKAQI